MISDRDYSTRTFGHEMLLPRVPLPDLDDSCARFLEWCAPLLTPDELEQTRAAVAEFTAPHSPARTLHAALERYDATDGVHSWLDTFWPYRYLGRRDRIALNANFFFLFRDPQPPLAQLDGQDPAITRAARLVAAAVAFKLRLDAQRVPPVFRRGQPQSMEQYKHLFSTTRIPGPERDTVRTPYRPDWPGPSRARHILVFVGGRITRLDVLDSDGRPYRVEDIAIALDEVRDAARQAASQRPEVAVGSLTTMDRAPWARCRAALRELDPANETALDVIETALFCVCLDERTPVSDLEACDHLLHGDGGNRWFDKAVSFIVFPDGRAGINVEHCELDGTTILAFVDAILGPNEPATEQLAEGRPGFEPVEFVLDEQLRSSARAAKEAFTAYAGDTASAVLSFPDFGARVPKRLNVSPDAFVQLAYQLAHQRAKGKIGATYESIATRHWRHGRTEAMRVVTPEALSFVAAMSEPKVDAATRREAFREAARAHVARAADCQQGRAPEQHLWELELIQRRRGAELGVVEPLELYRSPGWLIMRDDYLSTSSAPSPNIDYFGFGSTSSHCIGIGYVLLDDRLNIYLSTPRRVADSMVRFADELRQAIPELVELLNPS